jgi:hypothetical protein
MDKNNKKIYYIVINNKLLKFKIDPRMYVSARVRNSNEIANKEIDKDLLRNFIEDFTDYLLV